MSKTFKASDVASHNKSDDLYIIVDQDVYDLTKFQDDHPGGKKILTRVAGKDASKQFWKYHNEGILKKYKASLMVGSLDTKPKLEEPAKPSPAVAAPTPTKAATKAVEEEAEALEPYGDLIPFADPSWYQGVSRETLTHPGVCLLTTPPSTVPLPLLQRVPRRPPGRNPPMDRERYRALRHRVG